MRLIDALNVEAGRNLSMACLLIENGFSDGALAPLQEVIRQWTTYAASGEWRAN
jgi:hypothetical protein